MLAQLTTKQGEEATKENLLGVTQKAISMKIDLRKHQLLSEHISTTGVQRDIARLASLRLPHAGDWLNVVPSPNLGLHLRSTEWIVSAKYRLGCPVFPTSGKCPACPNFSDKDGDHAISCGYQGERTARHNHLRDLLYHTALAASLGPTRARVDKKQICGRGRGWERLIQNGRFRAGLNQNMLFSDRVSHILLKLFQIWQLFEIL